MWGRGFHAGRLLINTENIPQTSGFAVKPHLLLYIFQDTSHGDPAWKSFTLPSRGFHAGRLVKSYGKYGTAMWFCFIALYP